MGYFHEERYIMFRPMAKSLLYKNDEYVVTPDTKIELVNELPFHSYENNHLALSIFPSGEMIDMVSDKNDFFRKCLDNGEGFMDAYLEFNMTDEPYANKFLFIASDINGNSQEEEVLISKKSQKDIVNLLDKQLVKIGFQGIDELFADYEIRKCNFEIALSQNNNTKENSRNHKILKEDISLLNDGRG